ncbi:MAG: hypothetical protein J7K40_08705 [candidate division Zixibacteria bacterium]|nr:hypothetical protein [candidate division Zixibacteria bacterium]
MTRWIITGIAILALTVSCSEKPAQTIELAQYPISSLEGIITQTGIEFDAQVSSDGNGSIRISCDTSTVIELYRNSAIDIEDARLIYRASMRSENIEGQAYLEMYCGFPGKGEFFSKDLQTPLSGNNDWSTEETFFFLKKGENPDYVKLNVVINGKGTIWIDDIHLLKAPLK